MKYRSLSILIAVMIGSGACGQPIQRIDGSTLPADSLANRIAILMKAANVSGLAISVFNHNLPVYSRAFGLADVPGRVPLRDTTVLYGASESKMVFA